MNPPRNIPFGQMTTLECCQCLVAGKMPNGTIIDIETRKISLSKIVPILESILKCDEEIIGKDWIATHLKDSFAQDMADRSTLIEQAKKIISA